MNAIKGVELWKSTSLALHKNSYLSTLVLSNKLPIICTRSYAASAKGSSEEAPEDVPTSAKSSILGNLKRGRGGRSSFSGIVATVFGPSGFLGRYVCNELGKIGSQIIAAHRCDPYNIRYLKPMGDLGQVLYHYCDLRDEDAIRKAIKYSNVVINLIGRDWPTRNFSFEQVHVEGPRRLARLAREAGVERFIHFSALNASENPTPIYYKEGSEFLKSKYRGELAVREEFPDAIVFRPADMYGMEDKFINYYRRFRRRMFIYMPLWKKGEATIKQPVYVGDVARAVVNAIQDPDSPGKTYDCVGPRRYILADLVDYFFHVMRRSPEITGYIRGPIDPITKLKFYGGTYIARSWPSMHWQRVEREYVTDRRTEGCLDLEDLGITPLKPIEDYAPWHLKPHRAHNYYSDELGEFPTPPLPKFLPDEKHTELWKLYHQIDQRS